MLFEPKSKIKNWLFCWFTGLPQAEKHDEHECQQG
jgi:hypothetical protein